MTKQQLAQLALAFLAAEQLYRQTPYGPTLAWCHASAQYQKAREELARAAQECAQ